MAINLILLSPVGVVASIIPLGGTLRYTEKSLEFIVPSCLEYATSEFGRVQLKRLTICQLRFLALCSFLGSEKPKNAYLKTRFFQGISRQAKNDFPLP